MLSVERELLERILDSIGFGEREELRAILDNQVLESQYDGMTQAQAQAVSDGVDEILHGKPPTGWLPCSPNILESGVDCDTSPRWSSKEWDGHSHWHPAPISDHTQFEECKDWGYHENHHEGGGTECGECDGSGKATVAVVMTGEQILEAMRQSLTDADGGYVFDTAKDDVIAAGRALLEVARLNGVKT